jgi:hypothetical protein
LRRVKRVVAVVGASALMLSVAAFPALANNDPTVPADTCSGNPKVVGQPFGTNAVDIGPSPVAGPASRFNEADTTQGFPGKAVTDGAQGGDRSQAIENCNR